MLLIRFHLSAASWKRFARFTALLMIVVAACTVPPTTTRTPDPSAAPQRGGTAIVALWQEPSTLAPMYGPNVAATIVMNSVLEGLAETTNDGEYVPTLATRIPTIANGGVVVREGRLDVTWELRPGVTWSDGQPLTSADIKFTWELWRSDPKVNNRTGYSEIASIDTPTPTTAVVHYRSLYAAYANNFFTLVPKHLLEKEPDPSRSDFVRRPVGTGPFRVVDYKAGDQITLERSPSYRGGPERPYLDRIIFRLTGTAESAFKLLQAGEVHAMWSPSADKVPEIQKDARLALQAVPGPSVERIELNTAQNRENTDPGSVHPILGDIEVRKALLYATPKQQIIDRLLYGMARPGSSPVSQGWAAFKEQQEGYDPQKANELLERAGWARGPDGIRSRGGLRATLTYATVSDALRERVQQVLVDEWRAIGIEVRIQNSPLVLQGTCAGKDPRKLGSFDLVQYASAPGIDPQSIVATRYHSMGIPTAADCSGQNFTRFKSADADRAIEEAGTTLDQERRKAAYARALRGLNDAYVIIWLYDRYDIDARTTALRGWQPNTWQRFTWNAEDWWLAR